ncbi:MAG: S41 family peptidase [Chitinophagales bacterium]
MKKLKLGLAGIFLSITAFFAISFKDVDYFEISKNIDIFVSLFKELNIQYVDKVEPSRAIRVAIDAMLKDLDPYTEFYSEAETEDFRIQTTGKYGGIGSLISQRDDYVIIDEPYEGMPAQIAGLIPGDRIIEIDGKSMKGKKTDDVSKLLKGQAGSSFKLTYERLQADGSYKKMTTDITRKEIKLKNVPYAGMISNEIGYIKLESFMENAGGDVRAEFLKLKEGNKNMKGLVLDLRGNPGGLLHEAVDLTNIFIEQNNEIVSTKGKTQEMQTTHRTRRRADDVNIPLIVLTNGGSASASEIVAGAIQDYDRGVVLGGKTFGKGLVQNTRPLPYNTQMKVTTAKYYIPSGRCIQAINYAEKNPDGSVKKVPDSLKMPFKTKAGRIVYDGGGIDPDLKTKKDFLPPIVFYLMAKGITADFANLYVVKNPKPSSPKTYRLPDAEYEKFVQFAKSKKFSYESEVDNELESLNEKAESEKLMPSIQKAYDELATKLKEAKANEFYTHKKDIHEYLEGEIVRRYFFRKGVVEHDFEHDEDIKEALKLFSNKEEYTKLLK